MAIEVKLQYDRTTEGTYVYKGVGRDSQVIKSLYVNRWTIDDAFADAPEFMTVTIEQVVIG